MATQLHTLIYTNMGGMVEVFWLFINDYILQVNIQKQKYKLYHF